MRRLLKNSMSNISYPTIEPLIASKEASGSSLSVLFRCPESGAEVSSSASMKRLATVKSDAARSVKKNMWSSLRRSVTRAVSDALGSGAAGRIARDMTNSTLKAGEQKTAFSKEEQQAAALEAFKAVQASFRWDAGKETWIASKKASNRFEEQLEKAPVTERYDQGVLARALVELSAADGDVSAEEVAFIADFLDPEIGTVEDFAKRDALSAPELTETSEAVRPTIMMLAWACAMCDEELADAEVARLNELATGFGLEEAAAESARTDAQQFLFEQALAGVYEGGSRDDEAFSAATAAAEKMGIASDRVSQIDAGFRKAAGIV